MSRPPQSLSVHHDADLVEDSFFELLKSLLRLDRDISHGVMPANRFDHAFVLLTAVPLTSTDFSVSARRLGNVRHYNAAGEMGAATYELRLLMRSIRHIAEVVFRVKHMPPLTRPELWKPLPCIDTYPSAR